MMEFGKIEIIPDEDISKNGYEFFTIRYEYLWDGEPDETVLECIEKRDVYLAIQAILKNPVAFREMYP